jgi:hypothetical protein
VLNDYIQNSKKLLDSANFVENAAKRPMPDLSMTPAVLQTAIQLRERGCAPLWLRHQTKKPVENNWPHLPVPTIDQLIATYRPDYNLGVRLGYWSQLLEGYGLIVLDIDIKGGNAYKCDPYEVLYRYCDIEPGLEVQSGSGLGRHIWMLCPLDKLPAKANRTLAKSKEVVTLPDGSIKQAWMIEVLSTGKQLVCPPSIHPDTGQRYQWLTDLDAQPQTIPDSILEAIAEPEEKPAAVAPQPAVRPVQPVRKYVPIHRRHESVADAFKAVTWESILEPHGWQKVKSLGEFQRWTRPGKGGGISASTKENGFYPFTSSTQFESDRWYSKFMTYSILDHGGDMSRA